MTPPRRSYANRTSKLYKRCTKCLLRKFNEDFAPLKTALDGLQSWCRDCQKKLSKQCIDKRAAGDKRFKILMASKSSAIQRGLEHTIGLEDIPTPTHCVYLGVELDYASKRRHSATASIDRIDSSLGYVKGNIQVISFLANRMKTDATVEQLIEFAKAVLRVHAEEPDEALPPSDLLLHL